MFVAISSALLTAALQSGTCLGSFSEDFESGAVPSGWTLHTTCGAPVIEGGTLVLSRADKCMGALGLRMDPAQNVLCGDFDVRVDFLLPDALGPPMQGGAWHYASLRVLTPAGANVATMQRYTEATVHPCLPALHNYKAWTSDSSPCNTTMIPTTAQSGAFRITRIGDDVSMYYDEGSGWQLARVESLTTAPVILQVSTGANGFEPIAHTAVFDDLVVVSDAFQSYCTAKVTSGACVPAIDAAGVPSLASGSPFTIQAATVPNQKNGLLFYGTSGAAALPFLGGTLCVTPPLRRTSIQGSGGSAPPTGDCSGAYSFDFNAWLQGGNDPLLQPGDEVHAQWWFRDPAQPDGTGSGLSNALQFVVGP